MKIRTIALMATLMVGGQSWALTAHQKHMGCTNEGAGDCQGNGATVGGVGSGNGMSTYSEAFIYDGQVWEVYTDGKGSFTIQTNMTTGKKTVTQGDNPTKAYKIIAPVPNACNGTVPCPAGGVRRADVHMGAVTAAMTIEQAKQLQAINAAKAAGAANAGAAGQAAGQQAAKDAAHAKAIRDQLSSLPAGTVINSNQPVGVSNPSTPRRKP